MTAFKNLPKSKNCSLVDATEIGATWKCLCDADRPYLSGELDRSVAESIAGPNSVASSPVVAPPVVRLTTRTR